MAKDTNKQKNVDKLGAYSSSQLKALEKEATKKDLVPGSKEFNQYIQDAIQKKTGGKSLGHASGSRGSAQNNATSGLLKKKKE
ncbi:hypothetical protein [Caenispirillum bisanense]|uniref:hypothetical protein n=1 Tax=Caenispirillum bisanense TaxID=414052 RepID=UPI0031D29190